MRRTQALAAMALVCLLGCGVVAEGGLTRLDADGTLDVFLPPDIGGMIVTTVVLPKRGLIRRIVISPRVTLLSMDVRIRTGPGQWDTVKKLTGRYSSPITVRTDLQGDAVRVVETSPALRTRPGEHVAGTSPSIKTILVYGLGLDGSDGDADGP